MWFKYSVAARVRPDSLPRHSKYRSLEQSLKFNLQISRMRFYQPFMAAGLAALVIAHPVEKRQDVLPPVDSITDEMVAQLALYLEHLELSLYTGGYENFTDAQYTAEGFPPGFRENVGVIAQV